MGLHWEQSHFGDFDSDVGGEMNGVDFVGIDFAGEMNGVPGVGIDFGCDFGGDVNASYVDFGVDPLSLGVLGVGVLAGAAATGHHLLSIHHILNGRKKKSPAHVAAAAISVHDAENSALAGPSDADPYQLGG